MTKAIENLSPADAATIREVLGLGAQVAAADQKVAEALAYRNTTLGYRDASLAALVQAQAVVIDVSNKRDQSATSAAVAQAARDEVTAKALVIAAQLTAVNSASASAVIAQDNATAAAMAAGGYYKFYMTKAAAVADLAAIPANAYVQVFKDESLSDYHTAYQKAGGVLGLVLTFASAVGAGQGLVVELFADIAAKRIPPQFMSVTTVGRTMRGWAGAEYIRDPDQSTNTARGQGLINDIQTAEGAAKAALAQTDIRAILDRIRIQSVDGAWWIIEDSTQEVHVGHFGAIPDGYFAYNGSIAGTDNFAAIQAAIDWRVYLNRFGSSWHKESRLPGGVFRINKGLQLGYGETFNQVVLRGAGMAFGGSSPGSTLVCDFSDQPGISISSGRRSYAADLSIVNPLGIKWIYEKNLASYSNASLALFGLDDRDITSWWDHAHPTMSPMLRYNPCAGIAVDPYSGNQPPPATAWTPGTGLIYGSYRIANGNLYIVKYAGVTAGSGTGPAGATDDIIDGTVTWTYVGPSTVSTSYPAPFRPAFLPAVNRAGYGPNNFSSNMALSNVGIYGFAVGAVVQPCDNDGNGDFFEMFNCEVSFSPIWLSICNTQSRNVNAYRMTGAFGHTLVSTVTHGRQSGKLGGIFQNCSWSGLIRLINFGVTAYVGPHTFKECYVEDFYRIGDQVDGATSGTAIIWEGCQFNFHHETTPGYRGVPTTILGNSGFPTGSSLTNYIFRDCAFGGFPSVLTLMARGVKLENCVLQSQEIFNGYTEQWRARANNTLAGGLVVPFFNNYDGYPREEHTVTYMPVNETNFGLGIATKTTRANNQTSRDTPASTYTPSFSPGNAKRTEEIINPCESSLMDKAGQMTNMSLVGRLLTFTFAQASLQGAIQAGLWVGSVILDAPSGMVFFVKTLNTATWVVTAELQNGFRIAADGTVVREKPFDPTQQYVFVAGGGLFTPYYPVFGDLNTNNVISNVMRADGYGGFVNGGAGSVIQAGDAPYGDQTTDFDFGGEQIVTAVGTGSITLNYPFPVAVPKRRIGLWRRGS